MDASNQAKQYEREEPRFLDFPHLPNGTTRDGKPRLNRYSSVLTNDHDFPGAQAMLYAAGVPDRAAMKNYPHVGVASVWWEGNPCKINMELCLTQRKFLVLDLGKTVKDAVKKQEMLAWQYNTIGVSDAITMGGEGRRQARGPVQS
ncbi:hypothetical protein MMC21_000684 [Puttea exsequens]|nr:hypothetical protein [Puttea exsequens]